MKLHEGGGLVRGCINRKEYTVWRTDWQDQGLGKLLKETDN